MTSSNGNIFRVTGVTGPGEFPAQRPGALMFSLTCARINDWVNNREASDLRRYRGHYDVIVMRRPSRTHCHKPFWFGNSWYLPLVKRAYSNWLWKLSSMTALTETCQNCLTYIFFDTMLSVYLNTVAPFPYFTSVLCNHSRLIPMYNARFILWPPSLSSPITFLI